MTQKSPLILSPEVLFRYQLVSATDAKTLSGLPLSEAVRQVADADHLTFDGRWRRVSARTVYRWLKRYREQGISGLEPEPRPILKGSHVLSDELLAYLVAEHDSDPHASIPELLRRAQVLSYIKPAQKVDRTTVWRTFKRLGLDTQRRVLPHEGKMRRFAYRERMQMVLADFVHFRAGATRAERVALYFLDDATRYGLGVAVSTSENAEVFAHALAALVRRFGLMSILYVDRGPGHIAEDSAAVCARLGLSLVLGTAGYPEGRGKIERFNESLRARLLRSLDGAVDVDPSLSALTLRLQHDLFEVYNHLPHEGIERDTPHQRWDAGRPLRPVASEAVLCNAFTLTEQRIVSADHIISFNSIQYEVPRGYARQRITLFRRILENHALYIQHEGRLSRLHPVDLYRNATRPRGQSSLDEPEPEQPVPSKTASMLAFDAAYGPITTPDGGFTERDNHDEEEL